MSKVIVERPRLGGGKPKGLRRRLQRIAVDDHPSHEGIRWPWTRSSSFKSLNENLAPLRRFLQRRVGRPWDSVFSEICEHIRVTSAVQKHVRDHLPHLVALHVEIDGRRILAKPGVNWGGKQQEAGQPFYVHPRSGILRANPRKWKRNHVEAPKPYLQINPQRQIRNIDGIWYYVDLAPMPPDGTLVWDDILRKRVRRPIDDRELTALYGSLCRAARKRQLNSRQIRDLRDDLDAIAPAEPARP